LEPKLANSSHTAELDADVENHAGEQQKEESYIAKINDKKIKVDGLLASPIQPHEQHDNLIPLKIMLNWIGYGTIAITPNFGPLTKERVKEFQKDQGLPITGIIDNSTVIKINKIFHVMINDPEIKLASIKKLKKDLNRIGFSGIMVSDKLGPYAVDRIKEFQSFYELPVTGQVNVDTLKKIDEILNSPLREGKRHRDLPILKEHLNNLGFGKVSISNKFGGRMKRKVKKFQRKHGLPISGIMDDVTRFKLYEALAAAINYAEDKHPGIKRLKNALNQIGFGGIEISSKLGAYTIDRIKEFQAFYELSVTGQVNADTLYKMDEILLSPLQNGGRHEDVKYLKENLVSLGYGRLPITNKFGSLTQRKLEQFQRDYGLPVSGIADKYTFKKLDQIARYQEKLTYQHYNVTFEEAIKMHMKDESTAQLKEKIIAIRDYKDVETYFDPANLLKDDKDKFQLLDLSRPRVVTNEVLHNYLKGFDILKDKEQAFIDAGREHGINEILLVSHATLEVERGSAGAAYGIPVDRSGHITYVEKDKDGIKVTVPGETAKTKKWVYNIYGITDESDHSLSCRAKKAFDEGWDTLEKSIIGGAPYIKGMYFVNGQRTLYSMRWNLANVIGKENAKSQNTIDKDWFFGQIKRLYNIYRQLDSYILYLEVPIYKK